MPRFYSLRRLLLGSACYLLLLALWHPTHFMADDWERLYAHFTGMTPQFMHHLYYRFLLHALSVEHLFKIFIYWPLPLARWFFWMFLVGALILYYDRFGLWKKWQSHPLPLLALVPPLVVLAPNNHEWIFFPTVMTCLPALGMMSLGFWYGHGPSTRGLVKFLALLLSCLWGFYTYESLLVLFILLEICWFIYALPFPATFTGKLRQGWRHAYTYILPIVGLCLLCKIYTHQQHMQNMQQQQNVYSMSLGLHPHLLAQFLNLSFGSDYYKTLWAFGVFSLLGIILLLSARIRVRGVKKTLQQDALMLLFYLLGGSYYYFLMETSARRALGGSLFFICAYWGAGILWCLGEKKISAYYKAMTLSCFLLSYLGVHGYIVAKKMQEQKIISRTIAHVQQQLPQAISSGVPITVSMEEVTSQLPRGWNIVNPLHLHGMLAYYLRKDYPYILPLRQQFPQFFYFYEFK